MVLNQNYEPLNVCNARRALVLVDGGKAEVLEHAELPIRTPNRLFPRPSVIRLVYMIKRPRPRVRLTRREMFVTTCASCNGEARVPFQPRGDKPVYCSDCFETQRGASRPARGGYR